MDDLTGLSVKISNFKCFEDAQGLDAIKPINLIIGRNNSGKSSLLDMLRHLTTGEKIDRAQWRNGRQPEYLFSLRVDDSVLAELPSPKSNIGREDCRGGLLQWTVTDGDNSPIFKSIERTSNRPHVTDNNLRQFAQPIINRHHNPLRKFQYRRLFAERDIRIEPDNGNLALGSDGSNATNIIQRFLNQEELDRSLVEITLLKELNTIYGADGDFRRILARRKEGSANDWEIFLEEDKKGLIPMSHTGSGVKTILLVLIYLFFEPKRISKPLSEFMFALEELENNLHPSVLRRLLLYLAEKARTEKCRFFISTHSHVVIDVLSDFEDAQIIHITNDGESSKLTAVGTFLDNHNIFQDLGARASDLLQANALVWLEGPSDRIYFNRWISEWTNATLRENVHYTCVYSAGSLLGHYSYEPPKPLDEEELVKALRINPHVIVIIDRDRSSVGDTLKPAASRAVETVGDVGGVAWVTAGREIENYIPPEALRQKYGESVTIPGVFDDFFAYVRGPKGGKLDKVKVALELSPYITRETICKHLDLAPRLDSICEKIRLWNGIDPMPSLSPS